jgi:hypothetical protein
MSIQFVRTEVEDRAAGCARLLEDLAQTCAILRASCLEQAQVLRAVLADARVLEPVRRAEHQLTGWQGPYVQQPAPATPLLDG